MTSVEWLAVDKTDKEVLRDLIESVKENLLGGREVTENIQEMVDAKVHLEAAARADILHGTFERVRDRLFWIINNEGYYRYAIEEFNTFQEFLEGRFAHLKNKSAILFMVNELLPMLAQVGADWAPENILGLQENYSKTVAAIPFMREAVGALRAVDQEYKEILQDKEKERKSLARRARNLDNPEDAQQAAGELQALEDIDIPAIQDEAQKSIQSATDEFRKKFETVLNTIANPSIPTWGEGGVSDTLKATSHNPMEIVGGYRLEANRKVVFIVTVPPRQAGLIEHALRAIVDFHVTDPIIPIEALRREFEKKEKR